MWQPYATCSNYKIYMATMYSVWLPYTVYGYHRVIVISKHNIISLRNSFFPFTFSTCATMEIKFDQL